VFDKIKNDRTLSGVPIAIGSISGSALCQRHSFGARAVSSVQAEYSTSALPATLNFINGEVSDITWYKKDESNCLSQIMKMLMVMWRFD